MTPNMIFANRYRLISLIGRGGFAEVWLVEDTMTNLEVALKIYAPGTGLDAAGVQLFMSEFALVFDINHQNLLRPSHFDVTDGMPYLVLPYCSRGSCLKMIGKLDEKEIWKLIKDVAAGLSFLHSKEPPIIHQDIKPDNILCNAEGQYFISDFGISTRIRSTLRRSLANAGKSAGTLCYMAPERFSKDNLPIKASDIWSVGAMLYELMTNNLPFGEHGGLIQMNGALIPNITGPYSTDLESLVERCLSKETWDRPTAMELYQWADRWLNGERDFIPILPTSHETTQFTPSEVNEETPIDDDYVEASYDPVSVSKGKGGAKKKNNNGVKSGLMALFGMIAVIAAIIIFDGAKCSGNANPDEPFYPDYTVEVDSVIEVATIAPPVEAATPQPAARPSASTPPPTTTNTSTSTSTTSANDESNWSEAEKKYRRDAEAGDVSAQISLGVCYFNGNDVNKNYKEAVKWFRKAANQGNKIAEYNMGLCYEEGHGVTQNYVESAKWYLKSAIHGDDDAQVQMGYMYKNGIGVTENLTEAAKWYLKAAEQGNKIGEYQTGRCYYFGYGVTEDEPEGVRWFRKSANQGYAAAEYILGISYYYGIGIEENTSEGKRWIRKAAAQDYEAAIEKLQELGDTSGDNYQNINRP